MAAHTLLHEGGHALHSFLSCQQQALIFARECPIEFAETAFMGMELLGSAHLDVFFSPSQAAQVFLSQLEKRVLFLPYMSTIDLFQHWLYENAGTTHAQRHAYYLQLHQRFLPGVDWSGLERIREAVWQQKLHIFCVPFYYVEYGLAQLGALQLWRNSLQNFERTLADYVHALGLGGTLTLPQLFASVGANFNFEKILLDDLMKLCETQIDELYRRCQAAS